MEPKLKNHVELVELLGIADLKKAIKSSCDFIHKLKNYTCVLHLAPHICIHLWLYVTY